MPGTTSAKTVLEVVFAADPKLIIASACPGAEELVGLGVGVGAETADKGLKFQAVGRLGASQASKVFTAALISILPILLEPSPPESKGKHSLVGSETASESSPSTSFALLFSGVVGALPRLVAVAKNGEWETDSVTFCQNSSFSSDSS